ncbi:hypothetical protein F9802_02715 [Bacillus aerolatus]|uniref:DUF7674 domain-containing protein n=1 Tax=Bacillus aerolatus TaxID=2653354 RepID=A0A6I1FP11_9BACI|nr:hypothetical protein [Bacillus aerolatus]KAB7709057.1 hypothetical protein F9802_02715 [Bacillus aerolatus]
MENQIKRHEVMDLLIEACPSYKQRWKEYVQGNYEGGEEYLLYCDLADFANYLVDLYRQKKIDEYPKLFEVIELLHTNGDDDVKEAVTIGLLEDIQTISLNNNINPNVFKNCLKQESLKWWNSLDDFWNGKTNYVGGPKK